MPKNRRSGEYDTASSSPSKRSKLMDLKRGDDNPYSSQAKVDPTYGQRGAFPGLDDSTGEDGVFYGPASDGMEYLRMVRSEARTVPNLLVAPVSPTDQPDPFYEDYPQGCYEDGAYTAVPLPASTSTREQTDEGSDDLDPQEAYYTSLCARYQDFSSTLHSAGPTPSQVAPTVQTLLSGKRNVWAYAILNTTPTMSLLSQLQQQMAIRGLEVLAEVLTRSNLISTKGNNVGAWAWGLLGRCRELGQMSSEEVGVLRGLGKQAVWLLRRMSAGELDKEDRDQKEDVKDDTGGNVSDGGNSESSDAGQPMDDEAARPEDGEPHAESLQPPIACDLNGVGSPDSLIGHDEYNDTLTAARQRVLANLESTEGSKPDNTGETDRTHTAQISEESKSNRINTDNKTMDLLVHAENETTKNIHATLDVIVTIVGEFYGQRDLLDGRLLWDEMPNSQ